KFKGGRLNRWREKEMFAEKKILKTAPLAEEKVLKTTPLSRCQIERILYTTDLSPGPDEALGYAITLAQTHNAKLLLCHCLELTVPRLTDQESAHINKIFKESIATYISPAEQPELDWEGIVVRGLTASSIIKVAERKKADLIVMRSRRRPHAAALLGSVAESVSRSAHCPVFVIHPDEREWFDPSTGLCRVDRILVAYDFSE